MSIPPSSGLSAVLSVGARGDATTDQPQSAVAAIASRFNANALSEQSDTHRLSDKVSNLANRFGPTVLEEQKYPAVPSLRRPTTASTKPRAPPTREPFANHLDTSSTVSPNKVTNIVNESAGNVTNVAKIFDNGRDPLNKQVKAKKEDEEQTGFAVASNLFKKAEEDAKDPTESKVSSFAKMIESGARASRDGIEIPADNRIAGVAKNFSIEQNGKKKLEEDGKKGAIELEGVQVGNVRSMFENAVAKEEEKVEEELESRFTNATKLFESGASNDNIQVTDGRIKNMEESSTREIVETHIDNDKQLVQKDVLSEKIETHMVNNINDGDQGDTNVEASPQSRFADAARMFGGS